MNRFRTRRKAKEQQQGESYFDLDLSHGLSFGSRTFGRNKKPVPESKPVIDLASALPSSNDFRTSLIMPNLSARFSMLREQDDPSTKIGKANDDSVLFPKRASRLNLFSHNPLTDIAEVDSISESIRPPFAYGERKYSIDADGYDSDGASIMSRSRPGEGNNLFGGRQKLYKIPAESSSKSPLSPDTSQQETRNMNGRVMYENDVSLSLFQKHREKEREERRNQPGRDSLDGVEDDSPNSPATSFSKDRGTTSSTTSAPRRNSTAATSIDSQSPSLTHNNGSSSSLGSPKTAATQPKPGLDRNATMYRKLYGQALNQSNSLHRVAKDVFDNLSRPRAATIDKKPNVVSLVQGNSNLKEGSFRPGASSPPPNFRSASPPPSASPSGMAALDSTLRDANPLEGESGQTYGYARPLSPPVSDGEDAATFVNSVQPEDRGKATAMGLFNKPARTYNEQQFSERQLQMHHGRGSPVLHKGSPTPASIPTSPDGGVSGLKTPEASDETSTVAEDARARAASLIKRQNEELAALEAQRMVSSRPAETMTPPSQHAATGNTLLDDEDESPSKPDEATQTIPSNGTSDETHPAFRPVVEGFRFPPFDATSTRARSIDDHRPISSASKDHDRDAVDGNDFDPHSEGLGLSGLIRTHLRNDSDKSSIYPPLSPRFPPGFVSESPKVGASPLSTHGLHGSAQTPATDTQSRLAQNARQFLTNATLLRNRSDSQTQGLAGEGAWSPEQDSQHPQNWHDELETRHHRGGSTETQQEREAFNNELAERRRKVQEKLKNVVGSNSRSVSPALPAEPSLAKPGMGFSAMLRGKPSRSKLNNSRANLPLPPDHSVKAMKLLGLGSGSTPIGSPRAQDDLWKEEEERMLEGFGRRSKPKRTFGPSPTKNFAQAPTQPSSSKMSHSDDVDRSRQSFVTPASTRGSARDRSTSDVSRRSKSRNGQYRDDLDKAMAEGTSTRSRLYGLSNASNISIAPRPSIEVPDQPERSASAMSGRYRSNSRANTPGYFESMPSNPVQTSGMSSSSLSGRPSPRTPYSANSTPPIPGTSPVISNSSTFTLTQASQPSDGRTTPSLRGRKRSVTKNMISDPTFISTTYSVTTVELPPGASLRNGSPDIQQKDSSSSTPAIPFMNPSRRRGRIGTNSSTTHTLLSTLNGRSANDSKFDLTAAPPHPQSAGPSSAEERSNFSDEGEEKKPSPLRPRPRLRKVSSEGGDMNARSMYQALMAGPSPALPTFPVKRGPSPTMQRIEGGMF